MDNYSQQSTLNSQHSTVNTQQSTTELMLDGADYSQEAVQLEREQSFTFPFQ